jgi:RNA polymerase sigma-70 factor (sigma-E family)
VASGRQSGRPVTDEALPETAAPAIAGLFRAHHEELVRLAALLVRDQSTAEDVVQDVFARVYERGSAGASGSELTYIRAAVLNGCRTVLRRRAVDRRRGAHGGPDVAESAEREVMLAEDRRQVLVALAALPTRRREVLVLRYYLGLSEAEIADVLGISTGTVKSTAARGLAALARALGEDR